MIFDSWKGAIEIDGTHYNSYLDIPRGLVLRDNTHILLTTNIAQASRQEAVASNHVYRITVKQYMTKVATPSFDFMAKFNNDVPMPLCTMVGTIIGETTKMYKMDLSADTSFEGQITTCMKCGKALTNPVSQFFGLGPECGGHNYVNPFNSDAELKAAVDKYKTEYLANITWTGWVIKSAITKMEELNGN